MVLIGPSGAGKSTWAHDHLVAKHVVSSDAFRAVVGVDEHDQRAGTDAFDLVDLVVERRLKRGLVTVVDTLGTDDGRRDGWLAAARKHKRRCHAVVFDTPEKECRARNKARPRPLPSKVLTAQFARHQIVVDALTDDGFDAIDTAGPAQIVPLPFIRADASCATQKEDPVTIEFGLQLPRFDFEGETGVGDTLATIAVQAEEAGFTSIWVMDHFQQIPQVGRPWDPMLDSYTTLGFLAGVTSKVRLGTLVTGITYRNVAHLGKIIATLDVLSGGRANCGLGAAWFAQEHTDYGWEFPPIGERYDILEDALELLPLLWGPGQPAFDGRVIKIPKAICYPRPVQDRIPVLVGGSGETKTLRLVARHADACNLFGEADIVARKVDVLRGHCATEGRDIDDISVTQLGSVLVGTDEADVSARVAAFAPDGVNPHDVANRFNAATVDDHIGRFRELADAGVQQAIVSMPDIEADGSIERFSPIIEAFS